MSKQTIQSRVRNGDKFPRFNPGEPFGSGVFIHTQPTVDSFEFNVVVINSNESPQIKISFYKFTNGIVSTLTSIRLSEWRNKFTQDFTIGDFFIEVEANCEVKIIGNPLNFIPVKTFAINCYHADRLNVGLDVKRKPRDCSEALTYELIDGELPPGITLNKGGLLIGIVEELDCIDDTMSPSFNWYFDNHDGVAQSWGRKWRFKVRVSIASQTDIFTDEWFCLRVFNNWSIDQLSFTESEETVVYDHKNDIVIPTLPSLCPTPSTPQFVPERQITELPRYNRALDCIPCNDPNTPQVSEQFTIPPGLKIRTPDELIRYYIDNQNNFEPLIMQLHNSVVFKELLEQLGFEDPRTVFELNITDNIITIKKFWLENGSALNDVDATLIANRTITGQINPVDIVCYSGEFMEGVLVW